MRKFGWLVVSVVVALMVFRAEAPNSSSLPIAQIKTPSINDRNIDIGVSLYKRERHFYQVMWSGINAGMLKYSYVPERKGAKSATDQAKQIECWAATRECPFGKSRKAAIIIAPPNSDDKRINRAIAEAAQMSVPVFTIDIRASEKIAPAVAHVASDNPKGGENAADLLCQGLNEQRNNDSPKTVTLISERTTASSVRDRVKSFKERIRNCKIGGFPFWHFWGKPVILLPGKVIPNNPDNSERAEAGAETATLLQEYPHLDGLFCFNDECAMGASKALDAISRQAGYAQKVILVGFDATPEGREAVKAGKIFGEIPQYPEEIGKQTVEEVHNYFTSPPPVKPQTRAKITIDVGQNFTANSDIAIDENPNPHVTFTTVPIATPSPAH